MIIDSTSRESARARMLVMLRRVWRKPGYPPDKQEKAAPTMMEQAQAMCWDWAKT